MMSPSENIEIPQKKKDASPRPEYTVEIRGVDSKKPLILPISPDQPYHNNGDFSAILEYIEENNLNVILIIADRTLTNQMDGKHTPEAAALESETLIKDWKRVNLEEKNKDCYLRLLKNKQIEVYTIEEFDAKCKRLYKEKHNEDFRGDDTVQEIYHRPCIFLSKPDSKPDAPRSLIGQKVCNLFPDDLASMEARSAYSAFILTPRELFFVENLQKHDILNEKDRVTSEMAKIQQLEKLNSTLNVINPVNKGRLSLNLMRGKGKPTFTNDLESGIYIYQDNETEHVYALIIYDDEAHEIINLTQLSAQESEIQSFIKSLVWPENSLIDKYDRPGIYQLQDFIMSNCKHNPKVLENIKSITHYRDNTLKIAVQEARDNFCETSERKNESNPSFKLDKAKRLSEKYILKECSSMYLWDCTDYEQMGYPINANKTNQKVFNCVTALQKKIEPNDNSRMKLLDLSISKVRKTFETPRSRKNSPQETQSKSTPPSPTKKTQSRRTNYSSGETKSSLFAHNNNSTENLQNMPGLTVKFPTSFSTTGNNQITPENSMLNGYDRFGLLPPVAQPKNIISNNISSEPSPRKISPRSDSPLSLSNEELIDQLTTIERRIVTAEYLLASAQNPDEIQMAKTHLKTTREIVGVTKQSASYSPPHELDGIQVIDTKTNLFH